MNSKIHENDQFQYEIWLRAPNFKPNKKGLGFSIEKKSHLGSSSFEKLVEKEIEVEQVTTQVYGVNNRDPLNLEKVNLE